MMKRKVIRVSTIPASLSFLMKGQLQFLNQHYDVIGVSSRGEELQTVKEREGIRVKEIDIERQIDIKKDIVSLYRLYRFFKKEKPFIVHSITPKAGLLSMVAARLSGVPVRIHTYTGLIFPYRTGFIQKVLVVMDKILCACATNIYPEGQGVKKDLIKYRITSKPLKILANGNINGIDATFFTTPLFNKEIRTNLRYELKINDNDFIFIFVGRLVADKGINELVRAFHKLNQENKNTKLLLVGPTEPELDPLDTDTVLKMAENKNIIQVGFQHDIRPFLAISDLLVFPSYREGFPNVVMQAGAMDLPSIVTDISGCNEIIVEGVNGSIIPVKDEEALKDKMMLYYTDKEMVRKLASQSREMITSRYDRQLVWDTLLDEYRELENKQL